MIELLNLALAGGLAAAAAPVIIHIAHRRRLKQMDWGAMRFLQTLLRQRRRSLSIENLLLLMLRILALVCLALALMRPNMSWTGSGGSGDVIMRGGKTAAVVLIDDGVSSGSGRTDVAIDVVKQLALSYIDTLQTGDEISIIPLSRMRGPPADPLYDLDAARDLVRSLQPTAVASDIPALAEAGLAQLTRHLNPEAEIVLVNDGRGDGLRSDDRLRWDELRRRLLSNPEAVIGSRARPHVILLAPTVESPDANVSVSALSIDRALIAVDRPVSIQLTISHVGKRAVNGTLVRLLVNGRTVAERSLELIVGEKKSVSFTHTFHDPGSYVIEGVVEGARDPLAVDDRRALAIQVEQHLPVLLVEGDSGKDLDGSLGLVAAALDPTATGNDLFSVTRIPIGLLDERALAGHRVVVLGDIPALDAAGLAAIEHFVVAGGGVLVGLGPNSQVNTINRYWARGGDGFMPTLLKEMRERDPAIRPVVAMAGHQALVAFGPDSGGAWEAVNVRRHIPLDSGSITDLTTIMSLDGGDPILVERQRGLGRVALWASSLDGQWNDLPLRPAFVPLIRGLMASLGGVVLPPRNLEPLQSIAWIPPMGTDEGNITAEGPDGQPLELTSGAWEGHRALMSKALIKPGVYQMRVGTPPSVIRYAVAIAGSESQLLPLDVQELKNAFGEVNIHRVDRPARIAALFAQGSFTSLELSRWLIAGCILFLFAETLLTRRMISNEKRASQPDVVRRAA